MLKAIAIDDEPIALEVIRQLASKVSHLELSACFTNVFKAMNHLQKEKVDLIFLDIQIPDMSGIDFLKSLTNPPMVIFTTAYSEHVVESFERDAIDYLLKPLSRPRFLKACNKAQEQFELKKNDAVPNPNPESIFIKSGYQKIQVQFDDILYVESTGNYMQFVLENQKIASRLTMSEVEALLPNSAFLSRQLAERGAKKKRAKIEKNNVWIKQTELPAGPAYMSEIEKLLK